MVEAHQGGSRLTNLLHNHTLEEVWLALGFSAILSWQRLCFESPLLFSSEGAATSTPLAQSELFMNGANLLSSIVLLLSFIAASTGIIKAERIVVKKETFVLFASGMAIATILLLFVGSNAEHLVILPIACVFAGIGECALFIFYSIALASKQPRGIVATLALSYVFAELTLVVFELILPANLAICAAALPFVSLFFFRKGAKSFSLETAFRAQKSPNCDGLFSGRRSALRVCPDEGIASLPPKLRAPTFEAEAMQNAPIFASTCRRSVIFVRCKPLSDTTFSSEPVRHREFQA